MNGDGGNGARSEFIGYMKRAIEDLGKLDEALERRIDRVEGRVEKLSKRINNIEIKVATIVGGGLALWYLLRDLVEKHILKI